MFWLRRILGNAKYNRRLREFEEQVNNEYGKPMPILLGGWLDTATAKSRRAREGAHKAGDPLHGKDAVDARLNGIVDDYEKRNRLETTR